MMPDDSKIYCYIHPNRETLLRCNKCERPICTQCAVLTPTGYRCKECIHSQQKSFETAQSSDLVIAPILAAVIALIGSFLSRYLGFFTIFLAPFAGLVIVEVSHWATQKRRSVLLIQLITGAALLGSLPLLLISLMRLLSLFQAGAAFSLMGLLPLVWQAAYTFLVTSSIYYRLTGIRIG
jgi:hypothetical protein